jgi:hypothetical protein
MIANLMGGRVASSRVAPPFLSPSSSSHWGHIRSSRAGCSWVKLIIPLRPEYRTATRPAANLLCVPVNVERSRTRAVRTPTRGSIGSTFELKDPTDTDTSARSPSLINVWIPRTTATTPTTTHSFARAPRLPFRRVMLSALRATGVVARMTRHIVGMTRRTRGAPPGAQIQARAWGGYRSRRCDCLVRPTTTASRPTITASFTARAGRPAAIDCARGPQRTDALIGARVVQSNFCCYILIV